MYILGIHTGHDAAACIFKDDKLIAYCKEERLTRIKSDGRRFSLDAIAEVLLIAGINHSDIDVCAFSRMQLPSTVYKKVSNKFKELTRRLRAKKHDLLLSSQMMRLNTLDENEIIDETKLKTVMGLKSTTEIYFVNHHRAHATAAFRYTDWQEKALYITCDGGGDGAQYSAYGYDKEEFKCLYGGDETLLNKPQNQGASVGNAYSFITELLGFTPNKHEGKITGLAGFGKPTLAEAIKSRFSITVEGAVESDLEGAGALHDFLEELIKGYSREDVAASIQVATEDIMIEWVTALLRIFPTSYIGMSGGVFSNVRVNQKVSELPGIKEVFIFPGMGDEGLPVGNCVHVLMDKKGINGFTRDRLPDVFFGRKYNSEDLAVAAKAQGFHFVKGEVVELTAELLSKGLAGAIFSERMEMGPRALGARSILASPVKRELNDSLNDRLQRTEFMPFAPYVLAEDAEEVFKINNCNREACRFMTITTDVVEKYHKVIPAVVHIDGTARPQIIDRITNPLYYDILKRFKEKTNVPCLVNTSFNAHEEPIINTPSEALVALRDNRIDFLVSEGVNVFVDEDTYNKFKNN
jgi:carbamoyltransferase